MLRILTIGDPHFKSDNGESTLELCDKTISLLEERLRKKSLDVIAILGDILHRHEKIDLHPFHRAMSYLERIHDIITLHNSSSTDKVFLYILIGNHDRSNNRDFMTDEHVFNPLKKWNYTLVADKALIHTPKPMFKVLLMPYVPPGRFKEGYNYVVSDESLEKDFCLVLAHQEFHGAKMNLISSHEGDPWDSLKPLCVSGHVHDYQVLKSNLIYVGTPIQHGFADVGKKTVSIFSIEKDCDTLKYNYSEERIELGIKGRVTVKGNIRDFDTLFFPLDEFFVKAKLSGTKRAIKNFQESKKYEDACRKGIVFQFLEIPATDETIFQESIITKIISGKKFSERLKEKIEELDPETKKEYYKSCV